VPVAALSGNPGPNGSVICLLLGSAAPFSTDRLAQLYPSRASYLQRCRADADRTINAPYAHTYVLEDAYLRALAAALPTGNFSAVPKTAEQQRRTIVVWRKQVEALGRRLGVPLPKDLAHAGRGDIAPSPFGS
jgi:hypothetical protein